MGGNEMVEAPRAARRVLAPPALVHEAELEPGDVLLARGIGDLSDAICELDGGDYSHAAFWDGGSVVEATQEGVHEGTLRSLLSHRRYTDAYRFRNGGHVLGDAGWPPEPVVRAVRGYVGGAYASVELLLMGLLIASAHRVSNPLAKLALALLGGPAAKALQDWLDARAKQNKKSMVCTQVVTSGYYEADGTHRYAIEVDVRDRLEAAPVLAAVPVLGAPVEAAAGPGPEFEALRTSCARLVMDALPGAASPALELAASPGAGAASAAFMAAPPRGAPAAAAGSPVLPIVTPRELQTSPTLVLVGRLAQP